MFDDERLASAFVKEMEQDERSLFIVICAGGVSQAGGSVWFQY